MGPEGGRGLGHSSDGRGGQHHIRRSTAVRGPEKQPEGYKITGWGHWDPFTIPGCSLVVHSALHWMVVGWLILQ